ncbi:MAG: SDR family NAD(P)-dependent oxidoreductase [Spirochaeta sp.]
MRHLMHTSGDDGRGTVPNNTKGTVPAPAVALITGASSGLGAEFSRQLAAMGWDLIITARRVEKLQEIADRLHRQYDAAVEVVQADLANADDRSKIAEKIRTTANLNVLVNNAGFAIPEPFVEQDLANHQAMIDVHISAPTEFCHAAVPGMSLVPGGAVIINVASVAAFVSTGIYSAAKLYQINLSQGLTRELQSGRSEAAPPTARRKGTVPNQGSRIRIQALCPGFVHTGFHSTQAFQGTDFKEKFPSWLWLTSDFVVKASLRHAGLGKKRGMFRSGSIVCIPSLRYKLIAALGRLGLRQ